MKRFKKTCRLLIFFSSILSFCAYAGDGGFDMEQVKADGSIVKEGRVRVHVGAFDKTPLQIKHCIVIAKLCGTVATTFAMRAEIWANNGWYCVISKPTVIDWHTIVFTIRYSKTKLLPDRQNWHYASETPNFKEKCSW